MEAIQRMMTRQWSDLSHKMTSKRLKSLNEPFSSYNEDEELDYIADQTPVEVKMNSSSSTSNLAFTSPFHFYNSTTPHPSSSKRQELYFENSHHDNSTNNRLETGQLSSLGMVEKSSSDRFAQMQQPLQKMLRVSKSAIKERLPSTGSFNASSQLSVGASSPSSLSPKNKLAKALKKPNSNEEYHDEEDDAKHKQSQLSKLRKQTRDVGNRLLPNSVGRKSQSDSQNLLMYEELSHRD
ncbi:hypothetical protein DdX_02261 [Ditylenchus destructor]|uniref:Uncharacterized protein n=1 Tax=Ditylenchus destructor TaxID=166010 RepID=A0AAD4RBV8_9BILA|nr:hypothetical protein DdX_02261 [Ditylenchus destructor]